MLSRLNCERYKVQELLFVLVSWVRNPQTKSLDAREDVIRGLGPRERPGVIVVQIQVLANGLFELARRTMRAAPDVLLGERGEPALDLIQPRGRGGGEVNVKARVASEPGAHRWRLVRAVVVHHEVHIELGRHIGLDGAQEREELACAMPPVQLPDDRTRGDVERREQRRGAVAHVVVSAPLGDAGGHRQDRLGAIERLNLALLVHAQHHRFGGAHPGTARRCRAPCPRTADRCRA